MNGARDEHGLPLRWVNINYQDWLNENKEVKAKELCAFLDAELSKGGDYANAKDILMTMIKQRK